MTLGHELLEEDARSGDRRVEWSSVVVPGAATRVERVRTGELAPAVGLEPTTKRLTAARSTTELRRSEERRVSSRCRGRERQGRRVGAGRQDSTAAPDQALRKLRSWNPAMICVMPRMTSQMPPMKASVAADEIG